MILNNRNNLFSFSLPKDFMPDEITNKYKNYLTRIPGNLIKRPIDFINYSIQSINLPGISYDPVEQVRKHGKHNKYRTSLPEQELLSKEFTVTMQLLDGNINYWMMLDILTYWYGFPNADQYLPDGAAVRILDSEGNIVVTSHFKRMLFTEIGPLDMTFSSNSQDFTTFDCTFVYNELITEIELD
jgi:hypothetical protein